MQNREIKANSEVLQKRNKGRASNYTLKSEKKREKGQIVNPESEGSSGRSHVFITK